MLRPETTARKWQMWVTLSQLVPAGQKASEPPACETPGAKSAPTATASDAIRRNSASNLSLFARIGFPFRCVLM